MAALRLAMAPGGHDMFRDRNWSIDIARVQFVVVLRGCPILRSRIAKVGGRNRATDTCTGGDRSVPYP